MHRLGRFPPSSPDRLGWRAPPPAQKFLGPVPGIGGEPGNEPPAGPTDTLPTRLVSDPEVMSDADPPIWSPWARYATRLRRAPRGPGGRELSPMEEVHTALYESAHATLRRLDPTNPQLTTYSNLNSVPTTRDIGRLNEEIRRIRGSNSSFLEGHHTTPLRFARQFRACGIEPDDYMMYIPRDQHRLRPNGLHTREISWNAQWKRFFNENSSPTPEEVFRHLNEMIREQRWGQP